MPLRIFVNRKQLLQKSLNESVFHTPLLSSNSIVYIKSPTTRIHLSNHDMSDLCSEIRTELLLIVYELAPELAPGKTFGSLRVGQTSDFQSNYVSKLPEGDKAGLFESRIETVTRVAKFKYKLHYKGNWELELYINSVKRLADIRAFLLSKEKDLRNLVPMPSKRRILITEAAESIQPKLLTEDDDDNNVSLQEIPAAIDEKPDLTFKYRPATNLGDCIDIHILHRPQRRKNANKS